MSSRNDKEIYDHDIELQAVGLTGFHHGHDRRWDSLRLGFRSQRGCHWLELVDGGWSGVVRGAAVWSGTHGRWGVPQHCRTFLLGYLGDRRLKQRGRQGGPGMWPLIGCGYRVGPSIILARPHLWLFRPVVPRGAGWWGVGLLWWGRWVGVCRGALPCTAGFSIVALQWHCYQLQVHRH